MDLYYVYIAVIQLWNRQQKFLIFFVCFQVVIVVVGFELTSYSSIYFYNCELYGVGFMSTFFLGKGFLILFLVSSVWMNFVVFGCLLMIFLEVVCHWQKLLTSKFRRCTGSYKLFEVGELWKAGRHGQTETNRNMQTCIDTNRQTRLD